MMRLCLSAVVLFVGIADAAAQPPDDRGEYKYAGETCSWASYDSGRYIEMTYENYTGRIEPPVDPKVRGNPFEWSLQPSGERRGATGQSETATGALNGLCGAMIVYHIRDQQAAAYDRDEAYRELLEALGEDGGLPPR